MIAATVLVIGVLSMIGALAAGLRLIEQNRETARAHEAARSAIESMQSVPFDQIFARFNADPNDDPGVAGSAPGATFAVPGLQSTTGPAHAGGVAPGAGAIEFPVAGGQLSEDFVDPALGMPSDLNGDGVISAGALAGGYLMLPVRVRVTWRGVGGNRELQLVSLLIRR